MLTEKTEFRYDFWINKIKPVRSKGLQTDIT